MKITSAVIISVFGHDYTRFFADHIAPALRRGVAPGQLIAIATVPEFADALQHRDHIVITCAPQGGCKYTTSTRLGRLAMLQMRRDHGIRRFILHPPDCHFDKTILHRAATTNAKIITAVGLRLCQRTWLARGATIDDHFMPQLPSNLHPLTRHLCLRGGAGQFVQSWPSVTYEVYPDRIVGRSFHRHPVMVEVPDDYAWPDTGTVDDRFIASLGYRWEDYDNLTDSSQGYIVELCDVAPDLGPLIPVDQAPSAIDDFSRSQHVTDLHRQFYQIPFTWHTL